MNTAKLAPADAKAAAIAALESFSPSFISLATLASDGSPDLRMMALAARDGIETLWFGTANSSKKVAQLKDDPRAVVFGYEASRMREFRLFGKIELLDDPVSRRKIWHDDYLGYFPDGVDSPNLVVLKFNVERGEFASMDQGAGTF